jgi:predicted acetyltransferase
MYQIKKIIGRHFDKFVEITVNAYPGMEVTTEEKKKELKTRLLHLESTDKKSRSFGYYQNSEMLGVMRHYDFSMIMFDKQIEVGGLGLVAVDLLHKKEKICKAMLQFFHDEYRKKGTCMTALYPFRPDFYKKMGYGYGTKMNQYKIKPSDLPKGPSKEHIKFLTKKDIPAIAKCHDRYAARTHGMMKRAVIQNMRLEDRKFPMVGYKRDGKIEGYCTFSFKSVHKTNFVLNDMHIGALVYENREALSELLTFLHSQDDQVNLIVFNTQDDYFHHIARDPRNHTYNMIPSVGHESNTQGVGIMYRIIDVNRMFELLGEHNFNEITCNLKISIRDSFLPANAGDYIVQFRSGKPVMQKSGKYDVTIELDISDFSSLVMGVIDFKTLYAYNQAEISDIKYIDEINRLFSVAQKPICMTAF